MKTLEIIISKLLIYISFLVTLPLKVRKNRVSIVSYFNDSYGLEFQNLVNELEKQGVEVKSSLNHFKATPLGKLKYLFSFMYQTYLFNTSRVVILDGNNYVYSTIKVKSSVKTYQVWHALGAVKKFGSNTSRRYKIKGYDYLIVSSTYFKKIFADSLSTKKDNVHILGNLKSDYLFNKKYLSEQKDKFYKKYPELIDKKIVLYVPTFRGEGIEDMNANESNIHILSEKLDDSYQVISRWHPLVNCIEKDCFTNEPLYRLLIVADYVISDYSALIFDALILNKKTILYWYDFAQYEKDRGFSIDVEKLNLPKALDVYELYDIIMKEKTEYNQKEMVEQFLDGVDGKSVSRISNQIVNIVRRGK